MTTVPKRAKFTKGYVDKVLPAAKDDFHWDTDVKGFGLRITPTGKINFIVQGRVEGSGKEARITIGAYGVFTVDQARNVAREHLRTMRMGTDPREAKKQDAAMQVTLRQVADAYFDRPGQPLRDSTKAEMNRHIDKVFADWKDKPIASVTVEACRKRHREMCEKGLNGKPAPGQAQIALVTLRTLINFANRRFARPDGSPLMPVNPVKVLSQDDWKPFEPRDRRIELHEVGKAWNVLNDMRTAPKNEDAKAAIDAVRFLLLTGARRGEAAALTWDRVHLDDDPAKCWWHLREEDNKTGNPVWLPLSSQAVELLKARKPADDEKDASKFVFPSRAKSGHVQDTRAPFERICKELGTSGLSSHDLRRTLITIGFSACNIELFKMELLTNHVPEGVTARHYIQTSRLQYLHPEIQRISNWVEQQAAIAKAQADGGNVVHLPQRA